MTQEHGRKSVGAHAGETTFKTEAAKTENGETVDTVTHETARKAQRVVAGHSADTAECIMLLAMLGVGPEPAPRAD